MTAEEPSKAPTDPDHIASVTPLIPKDKARRYRDGMKRDLELLDRAAEAVAHELDLGDRLLPRNAYIGAPGTYARHVYNILRDVAGR